MTGNIFVSTTDELTNALQQATGGETILLAPGDYGTLELEGVSFAEAVTITSADPQDRAVFSGQIVLDGVDNLTFEGLDVVGAEVLGFAIERVLVENSTGIRLADMAVEGAIPTEGADPNDPATTGNSVMVGIPAERAITVRNSADVEIDQTEITNVWKGVSIFASSDVSVTRSEFHDIRSDGINLAGSKNVVVENNYLHDFQPWYGPDHSVGDHPDFIQYFGGKSGLGLENIAIRNNVLMQGEGGWTQGIFGHVGQGAEKAGDFTGFEVTGNFLQLGHRNGISLGDTLDALIADNVLLPSGYESEGGAVNRPMVRVTEGVEDFAVADVTILDNLMTHKWLDELETIKGLSPAELEARGITLGGNEIFETGRSIPEHWAEFEFAPVTPGTDLTAWIADAQERVRAFIDGTLETLQYEAPASTLALRAETTVEGTDGADGFGLGGQDDVVDAGAGNDTIWGRGGDDWIEGGAGNDLLIGGTGSDVLFGGEGSDQFRFDGKDLEAGARDVIADLDFGEGDQIQFRRFEAGQFDADLEVMKVIQGGYGVRLGSFEDIAALDSVDGFSVVREDADSLVLALDTADGGVNEIEILLSEAQQRDLEEAGLVF